ncbi:autoinducer-2 kinase [Bacillus sp. 1P06AnD]|uniref:autoinducer-2 kinase n=1 Tax=Bacillus sp. 1P06AnD TaxID=3132208 RepID=UPI0039A09815
MEHILALDAGTGSIRAVLFDRTGKEISCSQSEWSHQANPLFPGSMDFDYVLNWKLVKECISECIEESNIDAASIKVVSATSMREAFVLYDREGKEIWACANVDARAYEEVTDLRERMPTLEQDTYMKTGQTFALSALPRLLWVKQKEPGLYEQAYKMSMINDWILYKLSGELQMDVSNGSSTGLIQLKEREWAGDVLAACHLKPDLLPPLNEAGTIIGSISEAVEDETKLKKGTLVVSGGGDAQMASVGCGAIFEGQTVISGGSFWQQEVNTKSPAPDSDARIRLNCHSVQKLYQIETITFNPGLVMRWFRDTFCEKEVEEAKETGQDPYELLEQKASVLEAGSCGVIPIFSDTMNYMSWRHASPSFINLPIDDKGNGKIAMFRALEENAALISYGNLCLIKKFTGFYPNEVIFVGGASKGSLWGQILADVLGIPVKVPCVKEAAALGTAIVAGVSAGFYPSLEKAVETVIAWDTTYTPDFEKHAIYQRLYKQWERVYKKQLELADTGLTRHMWKEPGFKRKERAGENGKGE